MRKPTNTDTAYAAENTYRFIYVVTFEGRKAKETTDMAAKPAKGEHWEALTELLTGFADEIEGQADILTTIPTEDKTGRMSRREAQYEEGLRTIVSQLRGIRSEKVGVAEAKAAIDSVETDWIRQGQFMVRPRWGAAGRIHSRVQIDAREILTPAKQVVRALVKRYAA